MEWIQCWQCAAFSVVFLFAKDSESIADNPLDMVEIMRRIKTWILEIFLGKVVNSLDHGDFLLGEAWICGRVTVCGYRHGGIDSLAVGSHANVLAVSQIPLPSESVY